MDRCHMLSPGTAGSKQIGSEEGADASEVEGEKINGSTYMQNKICKLYCLTASSANSVRYCLWNLFLNTLGM